MSPSHAQAYLTNTWDMPIKKINGKKTNRSRKKVYQKRISKVPRSQVAKTMELCLDTLDYDLIL